MSEDLENTEKVGGEELLNEEGATETVEETEVDMKGIVEGILSKAAISKVNSLVRHLLTVFAGTLAAYGIDLQPETVEQLISETSAQLIAGVTFLGVYGWSLIEKGVGK